MLRKQKYLLSAVRGENPFKAVRAFHGARRGIAVTLAQVTAMCFAPILVIRLIAEEYMRAWATIFTPFFACTLLVLFIAYRVSRFHRVFRTTAGKRLVAEYNRQQPLIKAGLWETPEPQSSEDEDDRNRAYRALYLYLGNLWLQANLQADLVLDEGAERTRLEAMLAGEQNLTPADVSERDVSLVELEQNTNP